MVQEVVVKTAVTLGESIVHEESLGDLAKFSKKMHLLNIVIEDGSYEEI